MKKVLFLLSLLMAALFVSCNLEPEEENTKISLLEFQNTSIEMNIGDSRTAYVRHQPENVSASISYSLSNEGIISLSGQSSEGVVITALTAGSAIVIAKCDGLTAYLEVKVGSDVTYIEPYIVLPYTTLEVERGKKVSIISSLYGGKASDNNDFVWKWDSPCISLEYSGNCANITALKSGVAKVTVEHVKSKYSSSMLIVVPDSTYAAKYISTPNNVIKVYKGGKSVSFTTEIKGGVEADNLYTSFSKVDNPGIIGITYSNGKCEVTGKECGVAVIRASNSLCNESIDITVIVSDDTEIGYISCDNDFVVIEGNNYAVVTAKLIMEDEADYSNSFSYEIKDPDIVECTNTNNLFYIYGKKDGITNITIKNKYCSQTHDIMVIVQNNNLVSKINYITTESNFIKLENNDQEYEINVNLIGGNEADKNNFNYEVSDSSIIELVTNEGTVTYSRSAAVLPGVYQTKCLIRPKRIGSAKIKISNPKSTTDTTVTVIVYPAGTLNKIENNLTGEGVYKVIEGQTKEINLGVSGDINTIGNLDWSTDNKEICQVSGNKLDGILSGINSGITELTVSGNTLSNAFSSVVICGKEEELENVNAFYIDNKNLSLSKDTKTYYELKSLSEINKDTYSISSDNENICKASVIDGIIAIDAVSEGDASLVVTNTEIQDYRYIINVSVFDAAVSLQYPYSISGPDYVGLVLGQNETLEFNLKNAAEKEYSNILYTKNNENISLVKNGNKITVSALALGESMIEVSHPSSKYSKIVYVYVAETKEELDERICFFSEKSNYFVNKGDSLYLKVTSNKEEIYKDIVWSVSDLGKASIEPSANYALVTLKEEGFVKITASYGNSAFYYFYITVKEETQESKDETVLGLPSIIELLSGSSKKIEVTSNNLTSYELSTIQWSCKDNGIEINGNGSECIIKAVTKGVYELTVESDYLKLNKNILVVVGETAEDFKNTYVMNINKNTYNIKKGEGIEISLLFGSYNPDYDTVSTIQWKADSYDVVELEHFENNNKCFITALNEGTSVITITSPQFANRLSITVNVYDSQESSSYGFVTDRIIKLVKGQTKNVNYSIINLITNTDINDYSEVSVKDISEDCISVSLVQKNIRIKAERSGKSVITLYHPSLGIETKITVICAENETELNNIFTVTSKKDHYLMDVNDTLLLSLITQDNEDSRVSGIIYECDDLSIIDITKQDSLNYYINALSEGNAVITFVSGNYEYNVYIAVSKNVKNKEPDIITENILSLVKGVQYTTSVIGCNDFSAYTESDLFEVTERSGQTVTINPLECGEGELIISSEGYNRILKVLVSNTESEAKAKKVMNIDKRYYRMPLNTSISVIPGFYSAPKDYNIIIEDIYQNNVVKTEVKDNRIKILSVNPGIAELKVSVENYGSVILTFEVKEEKTIESIVENVKYNIYSDRSVIFVEPDSYETLMIHLDGLAAGESLNDGYIWQTDNSSFVTLNPNGYYCNVTPLVTEGECIVSVSNPQCNNVYSFKIKIGKTVENRGTDIPYIYVPVNTVSLKYGEEKADVEIILKNMEGSSLSELSVIDSNSSSIVKYTRLDAKDKCILSIRPVSCGYGKLVLHHPEAAADSYIDYVVSDSGNTNVIYLTTSDNYVVMKSGETKEINVSLENYEEVNGKNYHYEYDSSFLYVIGEGPKVQLQGLKEGLTKITVSHPQSKNTLEIAVNISNKNVTSKYLTTSHNVIETSVSSVMDSFMVTLVGDTLSSNSLKYESSDYNVLNVVGQENYCFYRGLSKGQAQITISHKTDASVIPISITVIVEDNNIDGQFITSEDKLLYLAPMGQNKTVNIEVNNVSNLDTARLDWSIYSQQNTNGSTGDVVKLNGIGTRGVITPLNEGIAKVRVCYTPLNLKFDFAIFVSPFGEISFSDSAVSVPVGDMYFESINVPSVSNSMNNLVKYTVDNDSICEVFGTSKVCCIKALKTGTAIVRAINTYDNSESQLTVQIYDESEESINKINLNQTSFLLNPRSTSKNIKATLSGKDFNESDKENISWSISGNSCVSIYPKKGPEVTLSLKSDSKTGKVNTGTAVITVTHNKCGADYKKTVYIDVSELQNYFTLSTDKVNVDSGNTFTVTANILGASLSDYDDVHWSIQRQKVEADGTTTTIAQVLNDSGRSCSIMGIEEGSVILNCFYKGDLKTCDIQVKGNRYFSVMSNSIQLFPGQEYKVGYNLRPNNYVATWYTSCQGEIVSVVKDDHDEQEITLKANKEGLSTITGVVNGIGTVTISVRVVYNPKLLNLSKQSSFEIKMFDRGTANYDKYKNQMELDYLCYPPEYSIKVTHERLLGDITENFFDVIVEENHDSLQDNPHAGEGKIRIIANREIPNDYSVKFVVTQYSDRECTKKVDGKSFNFTVCSQFKKDDGVTSDDEFNIYFKRYDGGFSMPNVNYDSPKHDMAKIRDNQTLIFGEGETHYIIIEPKHKGQYFTATMGKQEQTNKGYPLNFSDFVDNDGQLVCEVYTYDKNNPEGMRDHGYDGLIDDKGNWTKPDYASSSFYPRLGIKKPYIIANNKKYYFTSSKINYNKNYANRSEDHSGKPTSWRSGCSMHWNYFENDGGWRNWSVHTPGFVREQPDLLIFEIPYSSIDGNSALGFYINGNKDNYLKKIFSNTGNEFTLVRGVYKRSGDWDEHNGWWVDTYTGTLPIQHDTEYTLYNDKSSFDFNYNSDYANRLFDTKLIICDENKNNYGYARFFPSNNTNSLRHLTYHLIITINGKERIIPATVEIRECYRNYQEYVYDSTGNFTVKTNDFTNDNFKSLYIRD